VEYTLQIRTISLKEIYQLLKTSIQSDEAEREAQIILETILNISKSEFITNEDLNLTKNQIKTILDIRDRRNAEKIPLAYLLEEAHFRNLKLFVNSDVLIPRPETELLVELVLDEIKNRRIHHPTILDLCTGSGCIAISLKLALPAAKVYASDISMVALNVAAINAKRYNADIDFILGDYLDPFLGLSKSPIAVPIIKTAPPYFDVIVSNPPYVSEEDYHKLAPELHHEPKHALVGFPYKHIKDQSKTLLKENGFLAFEFGMGQEKKLLEIFPKANFYKDLANIDRILISSI
jgi:release factor glutamine methyltransferase